MPRGSRPRTLRWAVATALVLAACAPAERDTTSALLDDARECEVTSNEQLRGTGYGNDTTLRMLVFRSCMALRGWTDAR
jgi:hypothetical protein